MGRGDNEVSNDKCHYAFYRYGNEDVPDMFAGFLERRIETS